MTAIEGKSSNTNAAAVANAETDIKVNFTSTQFETILVQI